MDKQNIAVVNKPEILKSSDIKRYDYWKCFYRVYKYMQEYRSLQNKCFMETPLKLTSNFEYEYTGLKYYNSNNYNFTDLKIDSLKEYDIRSKTIKMITDILTYEEKVYSVLCLIPNKSETNVYDILGLTYKSLLPYKRSCIIKFSLGLDLEVMKGENMPDEEEIGYKMFLKLKGK